MNRFRMQSDHAHGKPDYLRLLLFLILTTGALILARPHLFAYESENRARLTMDRIDYHAGPFSFNPGPQD